MVVSSVYGLVLAGGKSSRMGQDKGSIKWFGKPQRLFLAEMLGRHCAAVYISCRPDQVKQLAGPFETIADKYSDLGVYGAILSAMSQYPNHSWLVAACDMPFVDERAIKKLLHNRDGKQLATAYYNPINNLPEPLLAIWEPAAYSKLIKLSKTGITCPRKALIELSNRVKLVRPTRTETIINVNTPADKKAAEKVLVANE